MCGSVYDDVDCVRSCFFAKHGCKKNVDDDDNDEDDGEANGHDDGRDVGVRRDHHDCLCCGVIVFAISYR